MRIRNYTSRMINEKVVLLFTFYFLLLICPAQQTPQYTQFLLNNYGMNPAACGFSNNHIEMLTGFRRQWVGFDDSPTNQFININTYFGRKGSFNRGWHGVGAFWEGDRMGRIFQSDNYYASYTYNMRLLRNGYIAFGIAAGARCFGLLVNAVGDPVLISKNMWIYPDFIPGVKFYTNAWTFDLSVRQLYKYRIKQGGNMIGTPSGLPQHIYFALSHKWWMRSWLLIVQSVQIKYTYSTLPSVDLNVLAHLDQHFAVGLSYRHMDAVSAIFQFRFDKLVIGLAYDYAIAPYRVGFANTEEMMLGISPSPFSNGSDMRGTHYRTAECPQFQY